MVGQIRGIVGAVTAVALCWLAFTGSPAASAQSSDGDQAEWEQVLASEPTVRLWTPTSGALLARTRGGLLRSDDAGLTWRAVALPADAARQGAVAVNPTNHDVIYAAVGIREPESLSRTVDGGATWNVLSDMPALGYEIRRVEVSPANPDVVYVGRATFGDFWLLARTDAGASWELRRTDGPGMTCGWGVPVFMPHPTEPDRAYRRAGCHRTVQESEVGPTPLELTVDRGATWQRLPIAGAVARIVGGHSAQLPRYYVAANSVPSRTPDYSTARVYRGENGVDDWSLVLTVPDARAIALAYAPAAPDLAFVGFRHGAVLVTEDGGQAWRALGSRDVGAVRDLALGIDGAYLFAATESGVWRLRLAHAPSA